MKIDPNHLRLLAAIIDNGGVGEGAERLGKSQPSVSRTLAALEARVGSRLFEKGRRPLRPTDLCRTLAVQGRVIAEAMELAGQVVDRYAGGKSGTARVAGTPIFTDGVISGMVAGFQSAFPDVRIDLSYGNTEELIEQLAVGNIDMAICPLVPGDVMDGFERTEILAGRNIIACSPNHPLARRPGLKPHDIAAYPWITPAAGSALYRDLKTLLGDIGVTDFKVSFSGGSLASIVNVLNGSEALTVLPYSVVFMQRHLRTMIALPIRIRHPARTLSLLWHTGRPMRPAVKRFRKFLQGEFDSLSQSILRHEQQTPWIDHTE